MTALKEAEREKIFALTAEALNRHGFVQTAFKADAPFLNREQVWFRSPVKNGSFAAGYIEEDEQGNWNMRFRMGRRLLASGIEPPCTAKNVADQTASLISALFREAGRDAQTQ